VVGSDENENIERVVGTTGQSQHVGEEGKKRKTSPQSDGGTGPVAKSGSNSTVQSQVGSHSPGGGATESVISPQSVTSSQPVVLVPLSETISEQQQSSPSALSAGLSPDAAIEGQNPSTVQVQGEAESEEEDEICVAPGEAWAMAMGLPVGGSGALHGSHRYALSMGAILLQAEMEEQHKKEQERRECERLAMAEDFAVEQAILSACWIEETKFLQRQLTLMQQPANRKG
jgi:hypothetical protein